MNSPVSLGQLRLELKNYPTKADMDNAINHAINELAEVTNKAFVETGGQIKSLNQWATGMNKRVAGMDQRVTNIEQNMATKKDLEEMEDRVVNRVVTTLRADNEQLILHLQGAHEDELASVEGRKDAPLRWRTMPVRLATAEREINKIKDHLEIS